MNLLKLEVPTGGGIFFMGQIGHLGQGRINEWLMGIPFRAERHFDTRGGGGEVPDEIEMRTVDTIIGFLGWHGEKFADQVQVCRQQESAMKEQPVPAAALGIAGKFLIADRQIGVPPDKNGQSGGGGERPAGAVHDMGVGSGDIPVGPLFGDGQQEGVIQPPGHLHDSAAAGTAPENRNGPALTGGKVDFGGHFVGISHDDKGFARLPEQKGFPAQPGLTGIQQDLVGGEVFGRGEGGQLEKFHRYLAGI